MKILLPTLLVLVPSLAPSPSPLRPQDDKSAATMEALIAPAEQHAMLQKLVGTWDVVVIVKDQSGAEQRTKGTMTRTALAKFHTIQTFQGEMMGMKFVGHGVEGYCPVRKKYFSFWTDSMTPCPVSLEGDFDAKKKEMTMTGEAFGMSGTLEPCRTVSRYQDDDHYTWTMFGVGPDGKESVHLTIEYSRKK
jgi:hypothetical protein